MPKNSLKTALILEDIQNDFYPGGALPVAGSDQVMGPANRLIQLALEKSWPVFLSRDWHPPGHISFRERGGRWPPHCLANEAGAAFHPALKIPATAVIVSKAFTTEQEAYSSFEGTDLLARLQTLRIGELVVAGLATDYCVKHTVLEARQHGFAVLVAEDGIRAVDAAPGDGAQAVAEMKRAGARFMPVAAIIAKYY